MEPAVLLVLLYLVAPAVAQIWIEQRDDPAEYQLLKTINDVRSETECATIADSVSHQAVLFNPTDSTCKFMACKLGSNGCRKCRNAKNSSFPLLRIRSLDKFGLRNCWRTFQHRVDDTISFYRNWTAYLSEFGQGENSNYWMGLEPLYQLTQTGDRRVRWEASMWNGSWFWWENEAFNLLGADQGYRVSVGIQDKDNSNFILFTWAPMNGQRFSTPDRDQDSKTGGSCVEEFKSPWWHNSCHAFNPNGLYFKPPTALNLAYGTSPWATGITIHSISNQYPLNQEYSMMTFECMIDT